MRWRPSGADGLRLLSVGFAMLAGACNALTGVDDVTFGTATTSGSGGGGTGAAGAGGHGTGGGAGGSTHSCTDGMLNGDEVGVDCGGATCPACAEDCTNGVDDNDDGKVDCEDPICVAFACVESAPAGWTTSVFYKGTDAAVACSALWPTELTGGSGNLSAPPATCSACTCSAPSGATCGVPSVEFFDAASCTGSPMVTVTPPDASCYATGAIPNVADGAKAGAVPVLTPGTCAASGGAPTLPPFAWAETAVLCSGATAGGGCQGEAVGVPKPAGSFTPTACVQHDGDQSCPDPWTTKYLMYGDVSDSRDCGSCACGAASGTKCDGKVDVYELSGCTNLIGSTTADGASCDSITQDALAVKWVPGGTSGGSCAASGGQPTGSASPAAPITVCCLP